MCREVSVRSGSPGVHPQSGFTLIELMIVVVIVAILAVVVLPSYQSYVMKARRTDAKAALTSAAQMLERLATENPIDGYSKAVLGNPGVFPKYSENNHYELRFVPDPPTASAFTLNAIPQRTQASDGCKTLTINQRGDRGVSADATKPKEECWQ